MKEILFIISIFLINNIFSQERNFSIKICYPQTLADSDFNEYTGVVDLGLEYVFYGTDKLEVGTSLNGSYFVQNTNFSNPSFKLEENIILFQPNIFLSAKMSQEKDVRPFLSLGYSIAIYSLDFNVMNGPPDENKVKGGINIGVGIKVEVSKKLFTIASFDYVDFNNTNGALNLNFSNNISIVKLGLGYKF